MPETKDDIIHRIEALFRLGEHPTSNPHEAANALQLAQTLLLKYNLDRAALSATDQAPTTEGIGKIEIKDDTGHTWKVRLASTIARANLCCVVNSSYSKTTHVFGTRTNVVAVVKMFEWITRELEIQAMHDWKQYKANDGYEHGRTWKTAFFDGAIGILHQRLQKPLDSFAQGSGRELVLANDIRVKAARDKVFPNLTTGSRRVNYSSGGYASGKVAGSKVRLSPQGAISGGQRALAAPR